MSKILLKPIVYCEHEQIRSYNLRCLDDDPKVLMADVNNTKTLCIELKVIAPKFTSLRLMAVYNRLDFPIIVYFIPSLLDVISCDLVSFPPFTSSRMRLTSC